MRQTKKICTLQVDSELSGLLHNTGSLLEDHIDCVCVRACVGLLSAAVR